jgi:glucokinase
LTSLVDEVGGDPADVRGEHVMAAARAGDPDALDVVEEFAGWVALGLSNLANTLDPQLFVLGGGLAEGADLYLDPIRRRFPDFLYQPDLRPLPAIRFAEWGPLAGAVGAALLPGYDAAE